MTMKVIAPRAVAAVAVFWLTVFCVITTGPAQAAGSAELVMFDSAACTVCRQFNAEIGDTGYAARKSARVLPLRRIDIHRGKVDFQLSQPVTMTPTFVFVQNGVEIARFYGYPGRENFFTLIDAAAEEIAKDTQSASSQTKRD